MSHRVQYTRERLLQAAEQCSDINEVIVFLGTSPYGKLRLHLYKRFEHFGIDISHFPRRAQRSRDLPSESELRQAVAQSISTAGVLRWLQCPGNSRLRALLPQLTSTYGIDTAHFLGQAHQRGKPGPTPLKRPEDLLVKHSGGRRTGTALLRRALREIDVPEECAECGTGPEWLGDPMTLEIDHISGDWSDDRPENLRLLCPNCHASTSTWCRGGRRRRS
ncbi:HNH endonuclease [Streptomyces sp. NPDC087844]|uniref:HNH endonuclease n=1 Tax=Streptomyces sp. NPDC087844 TaxID=3365805 RepID=UPI00381F45FE